MFQFARLVVTCYSPNAFLVSLFFRQQAPLDGTRQTVSRFRRFHSFAVPNSQFTSPSTQNSIPKPQFLFPSSLGWPLFEVVPLRPNGATCEILPPIKPVHPLLSNCSCSCSCSCSSSSRTSVEAITFQLIHQCLRLQTCPIIT